MSFLSIFWVENIAFPVFLSQHQASVGHFDMTEAIWQGETTPIVFLRPIGIAAGDAMRLMETAKKLRTGMRWRMAPPGVAADAYLAHRFSVVAHTEAATVPLQMGQSINAQSWNSQSSGLMASRKLILDASGYHRGRPVCTLGHQIDTSALEDDELAPLNFPEAIQELESGLRHMMSELVGIHMLFTVGLMAWEQRQKWGTHRLHAIESGQLVGVIDAVIWQFFLRDGCSVERMANADIVPMPRSGGFAAEGFHSFMLETALWELAKRCPEPMLDQMLPTHFLLEPITHRRLTHLKEHALGDHCVAILRALDTRARTADDLQTSLSLTRPSLMRALTCLALVRAIQPQSKAQSGWMQGAGQWLKRLTGSANA